MKVINLISGPRNISTALLYAFAQRPDFQVLDEPFYGYYLSNAQLSVEHPSQSDIIAVMQCDEGKIVSHINALATRSNVFVKGMAHHLLNDTPDYLIDWENVILIRHPKKLIASFAKVIPNPTLADIGIKKAAQLFSFLNERGKPPVVIDSDELMIHPEGYLRKLCLMLNIPFDNKMLSWNEGGIPEDGIWSKHWYGNVHKTTGFTKQQRETVSVPPQLGPLLAEAMPYYESFQSQILQNK